MFKEVMENGVYKAYNDGEILLTITALGNNVYKAVNADMEITAEVIPLDDYKTSVKCLEYKKADGKGRYKKSTKLLDHYTKWIDYILEQKGFIRKKKPMED